jgi:hypothetical protein
MSTTNTRINAGAAVLWASAFVIMALILVVASGRNVGTTALADVANVQDLTVLTVNAGNGEEVVAVLDRREEFLYVYSVEQQRKVELYLTQELKSAFAEARQQVMGGNAPRRR